MRNAGHDASGPKLILDAYNVESSTRRLASVVSAPASPVTVLRVAESSHEGLPALNDCGAVVVRPRWAQTPAGRISLGPDGFTGAVVGACNHAKGKGG